MPRKKTMRSPKWVFQLALTLSLLLLTPALAGEQSKSRADAFAFHARPVKTRVLFIGNSYTYFNNLPQMISGLAISSREHYEMETEMVTVGGATLKRHWEEGKALEAIKRGDWNYVVLQEQSTLGVGPVVNGIPQIADPKTFHEYARLFDAEIKKVGARTIFYLTWARQNAPESQAALTDAYQKIAKELNAIVAPVGLAWESALKKNPRLTLHIQDKSHPTPMGSYLAACVFYAAIYGKTPVGLPARVNGNQTDLSGKIKDGPAAELVAVDLADAKLLQQIAWETANNNLLPGRQP
jgi:hypothetical protein